MNFAKGLQFAKFDYFATDILFWPKHVIAICSNEFLGVKEMNDKDVQEQVIEVANDIGVTIFRQDVSVCHRVLHRNQRSVQKLQCLFGVEPNFA